MRFYGRTMAVLRHHPAAMVAAGVCVVGIGLYWLQPVLCWLWAGVVLLLSGLALRRYRSRGWWAKLYPNMRRFIVAITGPKLTGLETAARNAACRVCPHLEVEYRGHDVPLRHAVAYCGSCGCGRWLMSRLWGRPRWGWLPWPKNRLKRAYCPQRKQPGPYPDDDFLKWREQVKHEIAAMVDATARSVDDGDVIDLGSDTSSVGPEEPVVIEVDRQGG